MTDQPFSIHKLRPALFWLSLLFINLVQAQTSKQYFPHECIDCSDAALKQIYQSAITPQDSLNSLAIRVDNMEDKEDHATFLIILNNLLRLNKEYNLVDSRPYELFRDALLLWDNNEQIKGIEKLKETIAAFDRSKKIMGFSSLLANIRVYYSIAGLQQERYVYYQQKLSYYQENGPIENTANCLHGIGGYYFYKADYNSAISYYMKAGAVFKNFSQRGYRNEVTVVGRMYYTWGNLDKAIYYLEQGYDLCLKAGDTHIAQIAEMDLGLMAKEKGHYPEALQLIETASKMVPEMADMDMATLCYAEKAGILLKMNKPEQAYAELLTAIHLRDSFHIPMVTIAGEFEAEYYLFEYYHDLGNESAAEKHLHTAYDNAIQSKATGTILKYQKAFASYYLETGKPELSAKYGLGYITLNDSLQTIQDSYNIAEYEKQQEALANEKELLGLEQQKKLQRNYFAGGGILLLLLSAGIFSRLQFVRKVTRQLEEKNSQIEKARHRAEQSEKFKQEFLANMSHEIRTPMNAVMGMTNLLIDKQPRHDQLNYLSGIQQSSDTLLHIINDILDLSKIEAGKIELEHIDFSIRDEVRQVKQLLEHKADEKGLQLNMNINPDVPMICVGDPVRLKQVLINLAGNAIKFTEKGSVSIEVLNCASFNMIPVKSNELAIDGFQPAVNIEGKVQSDTTKLQFRISDTGIGIPKDKLNSVFESFSQAHTSDNRKFGGTGLGLSISKQLVELMGGTIAVESEEGSGTSFSFEIEYPVGSVEKLHTTQHPTQLDGSMLNGLKILVVDDNEFNRTVARDTLLSKAEVEITEAVNGQEALDLFAQRDFDVILMDVQMPVMDGFEATRQIRENFPSPKNKIQIIALTASVVRSDLDKCRAAGMDEYVAKPFKTDQLLATIAKATGRETNTLKNPMPAVTLSINATLPVQEVLYTTTTDLSYLEKFCEGDQARMQKYINMFLATAQDLMDKIELALGQKNYEEIASQVHAYKMKWIMMGMAEAKELAAMIEHECRQGGDPAIIKENVEKLLTLILAATIELSPA